MDDGAFGLHLAKETDPRDAGILFYVTSGAKDIGEALALFARYVRIVNEAARLKLLRTPEGLAVEVDVVGLPRHRLRQNIEFGISVILKALREVTGHRIRPVRAAFAHSRNSDLGEFERFYLCPVEFGRTASEGASSDLLEFSNDTLALPLVTADTKLIEALRPFCDAAASERNTAKGTLRAAVEDVRRGRRSVAAEPRPSISEGAWPFALSDRVACWLRGIDLVQPRLQALDGTFAVPCPEQEAASSARLIADPTSQAVPLLSISTSGKRNFAG